jgi:hypothetical protein
MIKDTSRTSRIQLRNTRWFKYDRDKLWLVYTQIVPVIFEPPCINTYIMWTVWIPPPPPKKKRLQPWATVLHKKLPCLKTQNQVSVPKWLITKATISQNILIITHLQSHGNFYTRNTNTMIQYIYFCYIKYGNNDYPFKNLSHWHQNALLHWNGTMHVHYMAKTLLPAISITHNTTHIFQLCFSYFTHSHTHVRHTDLLPQSHSSYTQLSEITPSCTSS